MDEFAPSDIMILVVQFPMSAGDIGFIIKVPLISVKKSIYGLKKYSTIGLFSSSIISGRLYLIS